MKKLVAMLLVAVLVLGMVAMVASAENEKESYETPDEVVITTGEGALAKDSFSVEAYGEGELAKDSFSIETYGEEELAKDSFEIESYGEEETGFFSWLKNLWKSVLEFFGL